MPHPLTGPGSTSGHRPLDARSTRTGTSPGVTVIHGATGGVGSTMLAAETAQVLASTRQVAVVDMDLYGGDLHYRLDAPLRRDTHTLADLVPVLADPDEDMIRNALTESPAGPLILPAPRTPDDAAAIEPAHVSTLIPVLARLFDHVIVDTACRLDGPTCAALGCADTVVLVVTPEVACVGRARRSLEALAPAGRGPRVFIVVNRSLGKRDLLGLAEIEAFLERTASVVLPEDPSCRKVVDEGRFVTSERTPLGRGLAAFCHRLCGV